VVAVASQADSAAIHDLLVKRSLYVPLMIWPDSQEISFEAMGISRSFMPFKILFDSTLTAVYVRGANNTAESQAQFEQMMLWWSDMVAGAKE